MDERQQENKNILWEWVKAISTLILVSFFVYKYYDAEIKMTVDFPTLLSLILALFSVALAALFYFKATDTSNKFYDNTYKFNRDIALSLAKIESGFGEKLQNIHDGYANVRDYLQNSPLSVSEVEAVQKRIENEEQEIEKVAQEKNEILHNLMERARLETEEKGEVVNELAKKEKELEQLKLELVRMKEKFRNEIRDHNEDELLYILEPYTYDNVVKKIGAHSIFVSEDDAIERMINFTISGLSRKYIKDLERYGYYDDGITCAGITFIRQLAKKSMIANFKNYELA